MGLTHYFRGARVTEQVIADVTDIIVLSPVSIVGPDGTGDPITDMDLGIMLNGEQVFDDHCETLHLLGSDRTHEDISWFCKTEGKPYDEVVIASLVSLNVRTGLPLRSDASWEDWALGVSLFERAVRQLTADERLGLEMMIRGMVPASLQPAP